MPTAEFSLPSADFRPAYLELAATGELAARAEEALASLEKCRLCPRGCGANRLAGYVGTCMTGRQAVVSSVSPHFGEEDCLRGWCGSGTIFFSQCGLRCVFCQNYDISQNTLGEKVTAEELAGLMLSLQEMGCHNINLVTPDHVVPQILEALVIAVEGGLRLPLVYNTGGYNALNTLRWLDGVVDIYMPDFKMADREGAKRFLLAKDYPEVAAQSIREMYRQTGDLRLDEHGLAKRGVLVRHLVMPDDAGNAQGVMEALSEISPDIYLNIMDQYHPAGRAAEAKYARINRRVTPAEVETVYEQARTAGLWRFDQR